MPFFHYLHSKQLLSKQSNGKPKACTNLDCPALSQYYYYYYYLLSLSPRRSIPILLYAVLDRPVHDFTTLMRYPQVRGLPSVLQMRW